MGEACSAVGVQCSGCRREVKGTAQHSNTDGCTQRGKLVERRSLTGSQPLGVKISKEVNRTSQWRTHGACSAATLGAAAYALMRDGFAKIMVANSANGRSPLNRRARHRDRTWPLLWWSPGLRNIKRAAEIAACLHTKNIMRRQNAWQAGPGHCSRVPPLV
jgi:hypothetical protein